MHLFIGGNVDCCILDVGIFVYIAGQLIMFSHRVDILFLEKSNVDSEHG